MTSTKTRVSKIGTVVIPVADQDREIEFYVEKLGFEKRADVPFGNGQRNDDGADLADVSLGAGHLRFLLKLGLHPLRPV